MEKDKDNSRKQDEYSRRLQRLLGECHREMTALKIYPCKEIFRIEENSRARKRLGCCKLVTEDGKQGFVIEIASALKTCSDKELKNVIFHELLHTCPGCWNHGQNWKSLATTVNRIYGYDIRSTGKKEEYPQLAPDKEPRYRFEIKCTGCGNIIYRQRSSRVTENPEFYRCSRCGGALSVRRL